MNADGTDKPVLVPDTARPWCASRRTARGSPGPARASAPPAAATRASGSHTPTGVIRASSATSTSARWTDRRTAGGSSNQELRGSSQALGLWVMHPDDARRRHAAHQWSLKRQSLAAVGIITPERAALTARRRGRPPSACRQRVASHALWACSAQGGDAEALGGCVDLAQSVLGRRPERERCLLRETLAGDGDALDQRAPDNGECGGGD